MASDVDICNLALAHVGDEAQVSAISPADGSAQAAYCSQFYPVARDQLLGMHAWGFATKRVSLAALVLTDAQPSQWAYAYSPPSKCLQPISILTYSIAGTPTPTPSWASLAKSDLVPLPNDQSTQDFIFETQQDGTPVLYTNVSPAVLRYIERVTDSSKFTGLFIPALARLLASYLAGPIIKGNEGLKVAEGLRKMFYQQEFPLAAAWDSRAQKQNVYNNAVPPGIQSRA